MTPENTELMQKLEHGNGYFHFFETPQGTLACLTRLAFTVGLMCDLDSCGYGRRYCFTSMAEAKDAVSDWLADQSPEPCGWVRDVHIGRRQYLIPHDWMAFIKHAPELPIAGPFSIFSDAHFWGHE